MKIHILNMTGKTHISNPNCTYRKGFAIYVENRGYLSLDGKTVYLPVGGRRALKSIIEQGLEQPGYFFLNA